ncbi:alpha/beta hydrolase [Tsuneonella amylolytica]|uniref:alpha/beta hydrolase n=1 Tax=Tsuneonella amylolytica TaxID=2338327 RepID=UPI000EAA212D|nr:alpha/beta fold hydrolase [Tsuneonella amylolytica]
MKTLIAAAALAALAVPVAAEEITASGPEGQLAGTLVTPADGKPVVLIVPGSGPTDRDGNNPMGVKAASYRLLAEALGARGIGSVRIDKRGMFGSKAAIADANAVTIADYVTDIGAWVQRTRQATGRDCVWLAGHSEGGLVALAAAGKVPDLCGVIVLAGPGMTMAEILRAQFKGNPANAPVLPDALHAIDMLEKGERVDVAGFHPALASVFNPAVQGYIVDLMTYDPVALAAATAGPLLIVQGGKDFQVPPANGAALHAARPSADYIVVPSMNHVLKDVEGDDAQSNLATYANPALPVSSELVDAVAGFVTAPRANETS